MGGNNWREEYVETPEEFKNFLAHLLAISNTIDDTGGDRSQFPDIGDYYGTDDDLYYDSDNIEYFFDNAGGRSDYDVETIDNFYDLIRERINEYNEEQDEKLTDEEIEEYFGGELEDEDFPGLDFSYDDIYNKDKYYKDNQEYIFFENDGTMMPIDADIREFIKRDDDGYWEYVREKSDEYNYSIEGDYYDGFKKLNLSELMTNLFSNSTARAIFRRIFRLYVS